MGLTIFIPFKPPASYLTLTLKYANRLPRSLAPLSTPPLLTDLSCHPSPRSLGFSTFHTNLLTIPSSVAWIILVFGVTFLSRRLDQRALVCLIPQIWALVFLTAIATIPAGSSAWVKYGLISALVSEWYVHPIIVAWNSTNANSVRLRTVSAS